MRVIMLSTMAFFMLAALTIAGVVSKSQPAVSSNASSNKTTLISVKKDEKNGSPSKKVSNTRGQEVQKPTPSSGDLKESDINTSIQALEEAQKQLFKEVEQVLQDRSGPPARKEKAHSQKRSEKTASKANQPSAKEKKGPSLVAGQKSTVRATVRPGEVKGIPDYLHVWPDSKTFVPVSRIDLNRFVCERGKVTGVFFSRDKGFIPYKAGRNLFLRIVPDSFAFEYPAELHVICQHEGKEDTYVLILTPEDVSSRTIILHSSTPAPRESSTAPHPRLKRIIKLVKEGYSENFDSRFTVRRTFLTFPGSRFALPAGVKVVRYLEVDTGDWVVECYLLNSALEQAVKISEVPFIEDDTVAVSVLNPVLPAHGFARVLVIREKAKGVFD